MVTCLYLENEEMEKKGNENLVEDDTTLRSYLQIDESLELPFNHSF